MIVAFLGLEPDTIRIEGEDDGGRSCPPKKTD